YDVLEDFGCWPSMYNTLPMYILIYGPLITVCAISFVYCVLSIRAFLRRRSDFNEFLRSASIGMSSTRYIRLMAIAGVEVLIGLPTSLYVLISTLKSIGVARYISWEDTHSHFSRVRFYPLILLKAQHNGLVGTLEFSRWSFVFISFIFFALFGFVDEAKRNYKRAFNTLVRPFGIKPLTSGSTQY
ncbi:GPCR fungal pheromone mating factor, partial [Auriculariales sp. MPI-PUGE-AT-0066]